MREGGLELLTPHQHFETTRTNTRLYSAFINCHLRIKTPWASSKFLEGSTKNCTTVCTRSNTSALSQTDLDTFDFIEIQRISSRTRNKLLNKAFGLSALIEGAITDAF